MSNDVDLSSKEWCDLIFEGKNKDFGAYVLRRTSVQRHNKAFLYTLIGMVVCVLIGVSYAKISQMIEEARLKDVAQQETTQFDFGADEQSSEEEEQQRIEEEKPEEKPEEQVAEQKVTELKIVEDDKVTSPPPTQEMVQENQAAVGNTNQEGELSKINEAAPKAETPKAAVVEKVELPPEPKKEEDDKKVFTSVEQMPQFPGGDAALLKYISSHLQYPAMAQEQGTQGRVVLQFVVTKNGSVGEVKVARSLSPECDREAIRVVKSLPRFTPGRQNGQAVNVWYTLPVTYRLQQ